MNAFVNMTPWVLETSASIAVQSVESPKETGFKSFERNRTEGSGPVGALTTEFSVEGK